MSFVYFDLSHAIQVHDEIITKTGGRFGILNLDLIESILGHVQVDEYYPFIEQKVAHIFFSFNKNHGFNDGNKRSSLALSAYFLELNGLGFLVTKFITEMENISVDVAENRVDKGLLFEIIYSIIYEGDYSESLKLRIAAAKRMEY